jgi:hypothetical protein
MSLRRIGANPWRIGFSGHDHRFGHQRETWMDGAAFGALRQSRSAPKGASSGRNDDHGRFSEDSV